jgi:hypothetical protein
MDQITQLLKSQFSPKTTFQFVTKLFQILGTQIIVIKILTLSLGQNGALPVIPAAQEAEA